MDYILNKKILSTHDLQKNPKKFWDAAKMLKRGLSNTIPAVVVKMKKADGTFCKSEAENAEVFQTCAP